MQIPGMQGWFKYTFISWINDNILMSETFKKLISIYSVNANLLEA